MIKDRERAEHRMYKDFRKASCVGLKNYLGT